MVIVLGGHTRSLTENKLLPQPQVDGPALVRLALVACAVAQDQLTFVANPSRRLRHDA